MVKQKVNIENESRKFAKDEGKTEAKAVMTSSMPDCPLDKTPLEMIAKAVIVQIIKVTTKTSNEPHKP